MTEMANALFNKVLVKVLGKFLAYYMNNFNRESFKLEMLRGTFTLEDIEVNTQFLKESIVLPNLEITKCLCDKIFIKIPWAHIMSEPIIFEIGRVELECQEIPVGGTEDYLGPRKEKPYTSYAWAQRIIDGIKMSVGAVDMKVFLNGYRGVPYIKKVHCEGISIFSADANWKPVELKESFVDDKRRAEVLFYKVLDVKSLTVSFARADNADPEFCTFMRELPVQIRMKVLRNSKDSSVICGDFQLYLPRADLSFSSQQWKHFGELLKAAVSCFTRTDQEYILYKDLGKLDRAKGKSVSLSWWDKRKTAKEDEKKEKEKARRLAEMELREQAIAQLRSIGADTSHLEGMPVATFFRVHIDKGSMNLLEEEDRMTTDPFKYAFGRLFFESMNITIELPPALEVPDTNKWTTNTKQRLMLEASLNIHNMACVIQENFSAYEQAVASGEQRERKQITILADNRSEDLNNRVKEVKRNLAAAYQEAQAPEAITDEGRAEEERKIEDAKQKGHKDFVIISWRVRSAAPEETNMERWLRSLDVNMNLFVGASEFVLLHRWWARIISYLETSSVGSDSIEAINLIKMQISILVEDMLITVPLHGCYKFEVLTSEELEKLPRIILTSSSMKGGPNVLGEVTQLCAANKIPLGRFSTNEMQIAGWQPKKLGHDDDGWIVHTHLFKPQRFQILLENLMMSVGDDKVMSPINFGMELTLHRFKTTEQLLLELCIHAELAQLHMNRAQYLLFIHFMEYLNMAIWPELELALLRKYGPSSVQQRLNEKTISKVAHELGHMPLVVNTHTNISYIMLHVTGAAVPENGEVSSFFQIDPSEKARAVMEMHLENYVAKSANVLFYKTGSNYKSAKVGKATLFIPVKPGVMSQAGSDEAEGENSIKISEDKGLMEVKTLTGLVDAQYLNDAALLLKKNNMHAFNELLDVAAVHSEEEQSSAEARVFVENNHLAIHGEGGRDSALPVVFGLLSDFAMLHAE